MKTNNLFGIWLLFLCATVLSGCNNYLLNGKDGDEEEDNEEVWYNNIPEGNFFSRGNTLRFYYIDEKGKRIKLIEQLDDRLQYKVLHKRYVELKSLTEIADEENYSYVWISKVYSEAMKKVQNILNSIH